MKRTLYWQNPPADRSLIDQMDMRMPPGSVSHESLPDRWITTFEAEDEAHLDALMDSYRDAYDKIVGGRLDIDEDAPSDG
ncbi:MAG TPA: hypothetical protein VJ935_03070 [Acidimicrobiia bacterium]|nr:hypothetical protein [Acidimicrobiia bacterium]